MGIWVEFQTHFQWSDGACFLYFPTMVFEVDWEKSQGGIFDGKNKSKRDFRLRLFCLQVLFTGKCFDVSAAIFDM